MSIFQALKSNLVKQGLDKGSDTLSEVTDDEITEAWELYMKWKNPNNSNSSLIGSFFVKVSNEEDSLQQKLREEAKTVFLKRRNREMLDNEDVKNLLVLLEKNQSAHGVDEHMINYVDFKKVAIKLDKKFKPFFSPKTFAKLLQGDEKGKISIRHFFNYVLRKVWLHQTRIGLSLYDFAGQGYLREADLENYIHELIPTLTQLDGLEISFYSFYVCTAVRKFFFFLDPYRFNKVKIQDILACKFLDDLLELRDESLRKEKQDANWFSATSALRVYGQYLNLDTDKNGMLSKEELSRYGTGTLTPVFIKRLFQEVLTYDSEMDYKTYLDFVLAMENIKEPQSLQYFFRVLDIRQRRYLTAFEFSYFFKGIQEQMRAHGQEPVSFLDVIDEIFDMISPADPFKVTLNDLIFCDQGDTIVSILIDVNGFWTYENREVLAADNIEDMKE